MNIISRGKTYRNPPLEIPRDEIFVFEEQQKKIDLKMHRTLYLSLCRTQWVERHKVHEVFFAVLPSILRALEAMSNERLFADQFGETAWNWDTDSKSKANNLLHAVSNFEFIIAQITTMKWFSILKPLSIKLQKFSSSSVEQRMTLGT